MKILKPQWGCYLLWVMAFCLASCSLLEGDKDIIAGKEEVYAGIYTQGIEDSNFNPCIEPKESWQLNSEDSEVFQKINEPEGNPVYVKLRGIPSEKGEYSGFFATYDRRFEVTEFIEARSLKERNCF